MILDERNQKEIGKCFDDCSHKDAVWLQCDYCGSTFSRKKGSVLNGRKNIMRDACLDKECIKKKIVESSRSKYGVDNYAQSKECKEKIRNTNLEKYGTINPNELNWVKEKIKETNIAKYGVPSHSQTKERRQKAKERDFFNSEQFKKKMLENYGCESPQDSKELMNRSYESRRKTLLDTYGVENISQIPGATNKAKQTSLNKYGESHYSKTDEYHLKRIKTSMEKWGVSHYAKTDEYKNKQKQTLIEKYQAESFTTNSEYVQQHIKEHGVPYAFMKSQSNKEQDEISQFLQNLGFDFQPNYTILNGKEIDLYNDELKIGIEYSSLYWHTELSKEPRGKNYHFDKFIHCEKNNVQLITIFGDEWKSRKATCQSVISSKIGVINKKYYARKCLVKIIEANIHRSFCELYHLQGSGNSNLVCFGLFNEGEMLGSVSLRKHHRNAKNIVLDRLCFKHNTMVVGGSSKLLKSVKQWMVQNHCDSLITWSDNRWSNGNMYRNIGFKLDADLPPDYSYVDMNNARRRLSKQSQKKSATNRPNGVSEKDWAAQHGLARIWDCGKRRWLLSI